MSISFFNKYFTPSFFLLIFIFIFHYIALAQEYYWSIWWYDMVMHFLGGMWVALFALWLVNTPYLLYFKKFLSSTLSLIVVTFIVGFLWEILELILGFTSLAAADYWSDTIIDLIMDVLGAGFIALIIKK